MTFTFERGPHRAAAAAAAANMHTRPVPAQCAKQNEPRRHRLQTFEWSKWHINLFRNGVHVARAPRQNVYLYKYHLHFLFFVFISCQLSLFGRGVCFRILHVFFSRCKNGNILYLTIAPPQWGYIERLFCTQPKRRRIREKFLLFLHLNSSWC